MAKRQAQTRPTSLETAPAASWSPSPSPSPPSSPSARSPDLSLSHADRLKLLEQHGPMRPSDLGLPNGKDREKEAMVVFSPEELERLVQQQQLGGSEGADAVKEAINGAQVGEELDVEAEDLMLWEEIVNAILWTVPFGFLFTGMCVIVFAGSRTRAYISCYRDYAVHAQFGQELVPREELTRLLNFLPGQDLQFPLYTRLAF